MVVPPEAIPAILGEKIFVMETLPFVPF